MSDFTAQTRQIFERVLKGKITKAKASRILGVSRKTIYLWLEEYVKEKEYIKQNKNKRKKNKKDILLIALANPKYGPKKISEELEKRNIRISQRSVWLALKELGLQKKSLREQYSLNINSIKYAKDLSFPRQLRYKPQVRKRIVEEVLLAKRKVKDVVEKYSISRKTFAKWKKRYLEAQISGENIILALSDQNPTGSKHPRGASERVVRAVLRLVIEKPELSSHKIAEKLRFIGNHGVQRILKRQGLSSYQTRLAYSKAYKEVPRPVFARFLDRVRYVLEQFVPDLAPAPPPLLTSIWRFIRAFSASLIIGLALAYSSIWWINYLTTQIDAVSIGLFFASTALFMGSIFFLYSIKYYLTLAIVLSFSQQETTQDIEQRRKGRRKGLLSWILGNVGRNGLTTPALEEEKKTLGLTPNLEHISLKRYPYVSIHIPFYNEKKVVKRAIEAVVSFDYPEYEVIFCDDSTDETSQIIRRYMKKASGPKGLKARKGEGWTMTQAEVRPGVTLKHLHRTSRSGFKGGALRLALRMVDPRTEFISVFDADFVPYPDTLELFLKYFQATAGTLDFRGKPKMVNDQGLMAKKRKENINHQPSTISHQIAVVQGYQWHVLNKSENWITRGIRSEYAGSYVIERSGTEIYQGLKMISGAVYMIRRDVLEEVGWETSITEDFQLTLKLYEKGYKVVYTPYIQAPAECVSTLKRLIRQRMRWAEGHSNNVRKMFARLLYGRWLMVNGQKRFIPSPLTLAEKLEFLYLSPYYLQAFFFLVGTISWLISETIFPARLPFWTDLWGWSLVLTNLFALPLMNAVGLFLEESEEKDYQGIASFIALSYIVVPFQAYASLKGFLKGEGPWFRTPKTGHITDIITRGRFYRFISGILPGRSQVTPANLMVKWSHGHMVKNNLAIQPALPAGRSPNHYLALSTANNQFNSFNIKAKKGKRWLGKTALSILLMISLTVYSYSRGVPEVMATPAPETLYLHTNLSGVLTGTVSHQLMTSAGDIACDTGQSAKHAKQSGYIQIEPDIANHSDIESPDPCPTSARGTGWIYDTPFESNGSVDGDFTFYHYTDDNVAANTGYVMACVYKVEVSGVSLGTSTLLFSAGGSGTPDVWGNTTQTTNFTATDPCGTGCAIGDDAEKYLYVDYYISSDNGGNKANAAISFGEEQCGATYPQIQIALFNISEKAVVLAILVPCIPFLISKLLKKRRGLAYA